MDIKLAGALLTDTVLRDVFEQVVDARIIRRKELAALEPGKEISAPLDQLAAAGLINKSPAPIEDFSSYYVTAKGLGAQRELARFEKALKAI